MLFANRRQRLTSATVESQNFEYYFDVVTLPRDDVSALR